MAKIKRKDNILCLLLSRDDMWMRNKEGLICRVDISRRRLG